MWGGDGGGGLRVILHYKVVVISVDLINFTLSSM